MNTVFSICDEEDCRLSIAKARAALAASPEGAMSKSKRTRKQVEKDLKFAIEQRERFATAARQTDDKDEKQGLYINVDNANARIRKLVEEREAMTPGR